MFLRDLLIKSVVSAVNNPAVRTSENGVKSTKDDYDDDDWKRISYTI